MTVKLSQPVVSFCIPVYNNAEAARKIVEGLLCSPDERFEVIVSDDASSDNAQEILTQIKDPRFKYYRNEKNLGAHKNWLHSLEIGNGEYLYLVMGRDKLYDTCISKLIDLILKAREENITCMKDRWFGTKDINIYKGINAMIKITGWDHPTGIIFSRKDFKEFQDREKYFEIADMYPENYVMHKLILNGYGAFIKSGVFKREIPLIDKTKIKSTVEPNKKLYDVYYAPRRRTVQFFELIDMIDEDLNVHFDSSEVNRYFRSKFYILTKCTSVIWRGLCGDYHAQAHHNLPVTKITIKEMIHNVLTAYHDTVIHLREKGTYSFSRQVIMLYITAKTIFFRIPLEILGVAKLVRYVKSMLKR